MKISEAGGERAIIKLIRDQFGSPAEGDLALGIGDDAALIRSGDMFLIVTTDMLLENTHFRMELIDGYQLGWKSAAVNISDVAAMGGTPTYSFVSIGLPDIEIGVVESIYEGIRDVSAKYGSVLAGGDTVASAAGIVINVVQLGKVSPDMVLRRDCAKPGDAILVTNTIGDSRAGLELLLRFGLSEARRASESCVRSHLQPEPRVSEAQAAAGTGKVNSMMDLSDGLASDLQKLCIASGVGAGIHSKQLPVSSDMSIAAARLDLDPTRLATAGGEDYELLLTCRPKSAPQIIEAIAATGSSACVIGEITQERDVVLIMPDGAVEPIGESWEHF
ncbi:MAG: thiamine-phosphate kinase [Armatimonadetes bacterium]|nr:thiamine-phosphate kinase [Armatimonadota bacterium]